MKNRIGIVLLIFAFCGFGVAGPLFAQATQPTVGLMSSAETVIAGEEVQIEVVLQDAAGIYGVGFTLGYDPQAYEVITIDDTVVQAGNFFTDQPNFVASNRFNDAIGEIEYAMTLIRPAVPINGGGVLGSVTFRALTDGAVDVQLVEIRLLAPTFEEVNGEIVASGVYEVPATVLDFNRAEFPATTEILSDVPDDIGAFLQGVSQQGLDISIVEESSSADPAMRLFSPLVLVGLGGIFLILGLLSYRHLRRSMTPNLKSERS